MKSPLYCPLHGTKLKHETRTWKKGITDVSHAQCIQKTGFKHSVIIEDSQEVEQEGKIIIIIK